LFGGGEGVKILSKKPLNKPPRTHVRLYTAKYLFIHTYVLFLSLIIGEWKEKKKKLVNIHIIT
jgi:hypothetical protein